MATTRLMPAAENHNNAIRADGGIAARTAAVLLSVAPTRVVMIAANRSLREYRLVVNHV